MPDLVLYDARTGVEAGRGGVFGSGSVRCLDASEDALLAGSEDGLSAHGIRLGSHIRRKHGSRAQQLGYRGPPLRTEDARQVPAPGRGELSAAAARELDREGDTAHARASEASASGRAVPPPCGCPQLNSYQVL